MCRRRRWCRVHLVVMGQYFGGAVSRDTVPLSDGAGEVVAVGEGVTRFQLGDRVAGTFFQVWKDGPRAFQPPVLGVPLDSVLCEFVVLHEDSVVALPASLSFEEGSALPCAGVTAWNADGGGQAGEARRHGAVPGDGRGVDARAANRKGGGGSGDRPHPSDEKLAKAPALGGVGWSQPYENTSDWERSALRLTGGRGVDHIVEIGGAGGLSRSFQAIGFGGRWR